MLLMLSPLLPLRITMMIRYDAFAAALCAAAYAADYRYAMLPLPIRRYHVFSPLRYAATLRRQPHCRCYAAAAAAATL